MSPGPRWLRERRLAPADIAGVVAVAVVAGAGVVWWQWPAIAGHDQRTDVVLLTDTFLTATERPVTYRIHEDGRTLRWESGATSWCDAAAAVRRVEDAVHPSAIVLSFADATGCDASAVADAVHAAGGHRVLIVEQPGRSGVESAAAATGATVIDPTRFIGDQLAATSMPCQWWESCTPDGTVAVRDADGALTPEGGDRVARIIVAELA